MSLCLILELHVNPKLNPVNLQSSTTGVAPLGCYVTAHGPSMDRPFNAARAILAGLVFSNEKACISPAVNCIFRSLSGQLHAGVKQEFPEVLYLGACIKCDRIFIHFKGFYNSLVMDSCWSLEPVSQFN